MLLKFFARAEHLQPWPDSHHYGQARRYIGWQWIAPDPAKPESTAKYVAKKDGDVVDTEVQSDAHVELIKRLCAKGAFYAADKPTADACGVELLKLDFNEAGFVPSKPKTSKE